MFSVNSIDRKRYVKSLFDGNRAIFGLDRFNQCIISIDITDSFWPDTHCHYFLDSFCSPLE